MKKILFLISFLFLSTLFHSCSTGNKFVNKDISEKNKLIIAKNHVINAVTYSQKEDYAMAILEYQEALRYSQDPAIYYSIAKLYLELNKLQSALENCNKAIELQNEFVEAYQLLTKIYYQGEEFDKLIGSYETIYKLAPTEENTFLLATLYEFSKDFKRAIFLYEEVYKKYNSFKAGIKLLELYNNSSITKTDNYSKIKEIALNIYFPQPKDSDLSDYIINIFLEHKDYETINFLLDSMEKVIPNDLLEQNYYLIAETIEKQIRVIDRKFVNSFLDRINKNFRKSKSFLYRGGKIAEALNDTLKADDFYHTLVNLEDSDSTITQLIASQYYFNKKYNQAINILENGIKRYPRSMPLYSLLTNIYQMQNKLEQGKSTILKSFEYDTTDSYIYTAYGDILLMLEDYETAFNSYERAIAYDAKNPTAFNNYAYALSEKNINLDYAEKMSRIAVSFEELPHYLDTYAWIQYQKGNFNIAQQYMLKAIKNSDNKLPPIYYEHLADIQVKLGLIKEAKENYQKALKRETTNEENKEKLLNKIEKINILIDEK